MNKSKKSKQLLVGHWNCCSISNKQLLLNKFLLDNNFDIFCLNETKLDDDSNISFDNYNIVKENRNRRVAILIKNHIKFERINLLSRFNLELACVKIKTNKQSVNIISVYDPPEPNTNKNLFEPELFRVLEQMKPIMLIGDLNCHSTDWYCTKSTKNGSKLANLILDFNLNVLNNNKQTRLNEISKN